MWVVKVLPMWGSDPPARKSTFLVIESFNIMRCPFMQWAGGQTIETTTEKKTKDLLPSVQGY